MNHKKELLRSLWAYSIYPNRDYFEAPKYILFGYMDP